MPEPIENENPIVRAARKNSERTEAKFFEDVDKIVAEAERLGNDYDPPNAIAKLIELKSKRAATLAARTVHQANTAAKEQSRNSRENLYQPLSKDVTSLVSYAKSAGKAENEIAALRSIARNIKGERSKPVDPASGGNRNSVSNMSFASRADNYAEFIEQYDALAIPTKEDFYKAVTHRNRLTAIRTQNTNTVNAEAASDTSGEQLDNLTYLAADSLMNGCISAKTYIKSKYGMTGQPYKNIAKTRLELPSRLRKK